MRRLAITSLAAMGLGIGFGAAASAADLGPGPGPAPVYAKAPVMMPWNWTGFYVGGNAGYHWGSDKQTTTTDPIGWSTLLATNLDAATPGTLKRSGVIGGGQIGYNWQISSWVLGVESDVDFLGGSATRSVTNVPTLNPLDTFSSTADSNWLATERVRLGFAVDRLLVYGTGGLALTDAKFTDSMSQFGNILATTTTSTTRAGWTAGGGLEYLLTRNWTVKGEYLHADFGTIDTLIPTPTGGTPNSDVAVHHKYTEDLARVGVNYLFH
jgi:outer membrane immunogenic protein